jgi:2-polyprenyl-3-methyl-5-hydroxy-6-metoxy-1,4-benzoquinol methylase
MQSSVSTSTSTNTTNTAATCDLCGSPSYTPIFSGRDLLLGCEGTFSVVQCNSCGVFYQFPRLPWSQLAAYYQEDYSSYAASLQDEPSRLRRLIKRVGLLKPRWYVEQFQRGGSLLDIGCGTGLFLEEMQTTGRWQLAGLEPTQEAADQTRQRLGIPVIQALFEQAVLPPASFDVLTMWHVLEHVYSPRYTLHKAWQALKPGGYLIFSVPNYESFSRRIFGRAWVGWDLPRHLYVFPQPTLHDVLQRMGFRVVDKQCFLISYHSLAHTLDFWTQTMPTGLRGIGTMVSRLYRTPLARVGVFPAQVLVEKLNRASVMTWAVQKVSD